MTFLEGQIAVKQAIVMLWHARIVSGAYRLRRVYHGTSGPEFTDEEKLVDALDTFARHCHQLNELTDQLSGDDHEAP